MTMKEGCKDSTKVLCVCAKYFRSPFNPHLVYFHGGNVVFVNLVVYHDYIQQQQQEWNLLFLSYKGTKFSAIAIQLQDFWEIRHNFFVFLSVFLRSL